MTALTRRTQRRALLWVGLALLLCALSSAWAGSPNDVPGKPNGSFQVSLEQEQALKGFTSPMVIPAASFIDDGVNADGFMFWFASGYMIGDGGTSACVQAPFYLPSGSTIASFYANVVDNNAGGDMYVYLYRVDHNTGVSTAIAQVNSTGQSTDIQSLYTGTISDPVVTWEASYFVATCVSESFSLYNARIWYN